MEGQTWVLVISILGSAAYVLVGLLTMRFVVKMEPLGIKPPKTDGDRVAVGFLSLFWPVCVLCLIFWGLGWIVVDTK